MAQAPENTSTQWSHKRHYCSRLENENLMLCYVWIGGRRVVAMGSGTKGSGFHHPFVGNMASSIVPIFITFV